MASASAVGSGRRCSMSRQDGVPPAANVTSSVRRRRTVAVAIPRGGGWAGGARGGGGGGRGGGGGGEPVEKEPRRLQVVDRRLDREGEGHPLGCPARPERVGL